MSPKIILIHPPLAKCSEPPPGIAKLSGDLEQNGVTNEVIDANLEGILFLLNETAGKNQSTDRWTTRARKNMNVNLAALRNISAYQKQSRYQRAVMDINRLLNAAGKPSDVQMSLADYQDKKLAPVNSDDLCAAAENPRDNPFYPYFQRRLEKALEGNPDFIGLSVNYLSQALCAFAMVGFIKRIHPGQKIILGGSLVTSWMKLGLRKEKFHGWADDLVEGPGEEPLLKLMKIERTAHDSPPEYGNFFWDDYLAPGRILPYSAAHGCYWHQCAFCPEKAEGNKYKPLETSLAANQLQILTKRLQPALIHILDSSISPAMLKALVACPPEVPWYGFARITQHLMDDDFCSSLKKSGCRMLKLGIESGDQHVLDQLDKGIDLQTISAALKALKKSGIATYCYLLFGTPPGNEESALKTMNFVAGHHDCIDFLNLAIFNLAAGSIEAQTLATNDFYKGDLSLYRNFKHPLGWHRPAVRNFLEKTFKKHPAIAPIVKLTPVFFTSNHAPFFV
jgi:hypothetical protein